MMINQKNRTRLERKLAYVKVIYYIFRFHNFHLKLVALILRVLNKKDAFLDTEISSNNLILDSLHQDIKHLRKKLNPYGKTK